MTSLKHPWIKAVGNFASFASELSFLYCWLVGSQGHPVKIPTQKFCFKTAKKENQRQLENGHRNDMCVSLKKCSYIIHKGANTVVLSSIMTSSPTFGLLAGEPADLSVSSAAGSLLSASALLLSPDSASSFFGFFTLAFLALPSLWWLFLDFEECRPIKWNTVWCHTKVILLTAVYPLPTSSSSLMVYFAAWKRCM